MPCLLSIEYSDSYRCSPRARSRLCSACARAWQILYPGCRLDCRDGRGNAWSAGVGNGCSRVSLGIGGAAVHAAQRGRQERRIWRLTGGSRSRDSPAVHACRCRHMRLIGVVRPRRRAWPRMACSRTLQRPESPCPAGTSRPPSVLRVHVRVRGRLHLHRIAAGCRTIERGNAWRRSAVPVAHRSTGDRPELAVSTFTSAVWLPGSSEMWASVLVVERFLFH